MRREPNQEIQAKLGPGVGADGVEPGLLELAASHRLELAAAAQKKKPASKGLASMLGGLNANGGMIS